MLALGRLITRHLGASGELKQEFAKRAGVSPQQLSAWIKDDAEKLREFPDPKTLKGLSTALGIQRRELLEIVSEDVDYDLEETVVDPTLTLLIAATRPLSDRRKERLVQIAKDLAED